MHLSVCIIFSASMSGESESNPVDCFQITAIIKSAPLASQLHRATESRPD